MSRSSISRGWSCWGSNEGDRIHLGPWVGGDCCGEVTGVTGGLKTDGAAVGEMTGVDFVPATSNVVLHSMVVMAEGTAVLGHMVWSRQRQHTSLAVCTASCLGCCGGGNGGGSLGGFLG